jgi:hypothetical protein
MRMDTNMKTVQVKIYYLNVYNFTRTPLHTSRMYNCFKNVEEIFFKLPETLHLNYGKMLNECHQYARFSHCSAA